MNYAETLNYIHSLGKFRLEAGLSRMKKVLTLLDNPQNNFKSIHIAGTNGKGSISAFCAEILKNSGYKTGLFISPFVIDFRERIQIDGNYITKEDLCLYSQRIIDTRVELNEFEFITALGFLYYSEKNIDIAVIETGLGGRLDPTNVLENISCCTIAKIGLDHTKILGDTIEKITREKCGILRKNVPTVTIYNQDEKALKIIEEYDSDFTIPETPRIIKSDISGNSFIYKGKEYEISLLGEHQVFNAITAIETIKATKLNVSDNPIKTGLENTKFPCRLEIIRKNPLYIIDGAHNPDGALVLRKFLDNGESKTGIIAMMRDKDCEEILKITLPYFDSIIVTQIDNPRCMSSTELGTLAKKYCKTVTVCADTKKAIEQSFNKNKTCFAFGSLYFASAVREKLIKEQ